MRLLDEFKSFALKGNVVDMAVGVILGEAFGKIVSSAVSDILMPPVGRLLGSANFADRFITLDSGKADALTSLAHAREAGAAVVAYGHFVDVCLDFVIVALCMFFVAKTFNAVAPAEPAAERPKADMKDCGFCLTAIPTRATRCAHCTAVLN